MKFTLISTYNLIKLRVHLIKDGIKNAEIG